MFPLRDDGVGPHVVVAGSIPASAIPKKGVGPLIDKKNQEKNDQKNR